MARYRIGPCACCGKVGPIGGRRLSPRCYYRAERDGTLADYPRVTRPIEDVLDDYRTLRQDGYTLEQMALRIGMRRAALERALIRARRRGLLTPAGGAW